MIKLKRVIFLLIALLEFCYADIFHPAPRAPSRGRSSPGDSSVKTRYTPRNEMDASYWINQAQAELLKKVNRKENWRKAKNVIFFMGDGMSLPTLTAARILKGQRLGKPGEESKLAVENMPYSGLSKTYCTNSQTADSACTATAYLCGVKTNLYLIGVNAHVNYNNCSASANERNHVESIMTWAQRAGKATGIVTTTTVTHASPSAAYAHAANRFWENDAEILKSGADPKQGCKDIAIQLIRDAPGRNFDVIFGGGTKHFLPHNVTDEFGQNGTRWDGNNLIEEWKKNNPNGAFITTRRELLALNARNPKRVLGTFNNGDLEYHLDAAKKRPTQPRLKEMTVEAISLLQKKPNGYFIFIEGGRIDHGHHNTIAGYALDETLEFDKAIQAAVDMTDERDTLIVVTSDHSHTMSIAGYPGRGNPILDVNPYDVDSDNTVYNTLNYAVGIEQYLLKDGKRQDLTGKITPLSYTPSYIKATAGTHAGDDVAIFASGPHAQLFTGVMEQNQIPHLMAYAAKLGNGVK